MELILETVGGGETGEVDEVPDGLYSVFRSSYLSERGRPGPTTQLWPLHHRHNHIQTHCVVERCQVTVGPVTLSCVFFYRPAIVIFKVFVNVFVLVILESGEPPPGPLPP